MNGNNFKFFIFELPGSSFSSQTLSFIFTFIPFFTKSYTFYCLFIAPQFLRQFYIQIVIEFRNVKIIEKLVNWVVSICH